ncbi:MAG: glycosyltransferase family 2 protein [Chloroflexales bacterium]|nr:glycosyltransferase family 2 protein [Chloroflexales bacterium]
MTVTPKLAVIIPVYNEIHTVAAIVTKLHQLPFAIEVIVVDDASTDGTRAITETLAQSQHIQLICHTHNRGKGAAIRSALAVVNAPVVVIQDADLEYDPNDFVAMLACVENCAQVVYGTRFGRGIPQGMLLSHFVANRLLTMCFNLGYGCFLSDLETCYKMWRTAVLAGITIDNDRFDIDPELTAKVVRSGYTIHEVPVSYQGRPYRAGKKIRARDAFSALAALWRYRRWQK